MPFMWRTRPWRTVTRVQKDADVSGVHDAVVNQNATSFSFIGLSAAVLRQYNKRKGAMFWPGSVVTITEGMGGGGEKTP